MNNFKVNFPTTIDFGKNKIEGLGDHIIPFGKRVLLVYGSSSLKKAGIYDKILDIFQKSNIEHFEVSDVKPNPDITSVRDGVAKCKKHKIDLVLAAGGGSILDCAKAIAAGNYYDGDPWDFFTEKAPITKALPLGCILTLAATGSEMNGNAVINHDAIKEKRSVINPLLRPAFSTLDPTYTFSVNKYHTAAGVIDIMSHIFTFYFSTPQSIFVQDRIAEALLKTCVKFAPEALNNPNDYEARANLMWASTLALNGLLEAGRGFDWIIHSLENDFSGIYDITHGVGIAIIIPAYLEYVLDENTAPKLAEYARNIWDVIDQNDLDAAKSGIKKTKEFFSELGIPVSFREVDIPKDKFDQIAEKLSAGMGDGIGGFKELSKEDIINILNLAS